MNTCRRAVKRCRGLLILGIAAISALHAESLTIIPGSYAIEAQMMMPHLDEMRQISKHSSACINDADPAQFFPVFRQPALSGCELRFDRSTAGSVHYELSCNSINGASGTARLTIRGDHVQGVLKVKMGGKNMTFSQHVNASRQGSCISRTAADSDFNDPQSGGVRKGKHSPPAPD